MKLYFIGIGGISMSALAQFLHDLGNDVSGSDVVENDQVKILKSKGIKVFVPQKKENIDKKINEVVYTSAITPGSPGDTELQEAKRLEIKTKKRAQKIGEITKKMKTIAISGTHGKSTTTSMMLQVMLENKKDPSTLLGSGFDLIGGNYRIGKDKNLVLEADEFDRSFLSFYVDYGALLNIEPDHLDYFKGGIQEIREVFVEYLENNLKKSAVLVYNNEDANIKKVIGRLKRKDLELISFGKGGDFTLKDLKTEMKVPGFHNRMNALAVFALASKLILDEDKTLKALGDFKGAERRFDYKGKKNGVIVYDDYAHHPTEVKATLQAARENFTRKRVIAVFQPHQYSRTKFFANDFVASFKDADIVIIPPIYQVMGRDEKKEIDNFKLAKMIKKNGKICFATENFDKTVVKLKEITKSGDLLIVMGAGPVNEVADKFLNT